MNAHGVPHDEVDNQPALVAPREAVLAFLSDDHNADQGLAAARAVIDAVVAEAGADGVRDAAVELASRLASALERIATEQGLVASELAEVWFLD
ncbi:hypothetical protein LWC35_08955 [Pseudonocardia kujensis]|uniref:hypothetical protein n=1 Tax=Pseudonocardia kujensis TaxID=1128675 RepID=UPI001E3BED30|nr:hypothetical protein [Pseudonocardia kujensis]MCE0763042.1 hypothetical protein [Pseudonocardia kujensis]